jgi:hypothetical protein
MLAIDNAVVATAATIDGTETPENRSNAKVNAAQAICSMPNQKPTGDAVRVNDDVVGIATSVSREC